MKFFIQYGIIFVSELLLLIVNQAWCDEPWPPPLKVTNRENDVLIEYEHSENFTWKINVNTSFIDKIKYSPENKCESRFNNHYDFCIRWGDLASFAIRIYGNDAQKFYIVSYDRNVSLTTNFDINHMHLYGGPASYGQYWPAEKNQFHEIPYLSRNGDGRQIVEPYWLTSKGYSINVEKEPNVQYFMTLDNQTNVFSLITKRTSPYQTNPSTTFYIHDLKSPKKAQEYATRSQLQSLKSIPDIKMVEHPIWTTWAKYKTNINEWVVMEFATNILKNNFTNSQLEIDDKWETCYGSLTVDTKKFPEMKKMVNLLKMMGFRVTIWAHLFINVDCEPYYSEAKRAGYLAVSLTGSVSDLHKTNWRNGIAGIIDFSNPNTSKWYESRLRKFQQETNIDGFKFDGGEFGILSRVEHYFLTEQYMYEYVKLAYSFGSIGEVVSTKGTQEFGMFTRMMELNSNWSHEKGLASLIARLLHMNILGYPFVLPDVIGGNLNDGEVPDAELFIRWLQATVFMSSLQFSYPPWEFNTTVVDLTRNFVDLHKEYSGLIIDLMNLNLMNGSFATYHPAPINRPIWWIDPKDEEALKIDSEFLLGSDILVAPVLTKGARSRNIYLPKGRWRDESNPEHPIINGKKWLKNYPVDFSTLPYFTLVGTETESDVVPPVNSQFSFIFFILFAFIAIGAAVCCAWICLGRRFSIGPD